MTYVILTEQGFGYLTKSLSEAGLRAVDAMPVLEDIADDQMRVIDATFQSQGRRGGGSWKPLNPKYLHYKLVAGFDERILFRRGIMHAALTERGHPRQLLEITRVSIRLGTSLDYPMLHQRGNDKLPARPFIAFTNHDYTRWANWLGKYIVAPLKRRDGFRYGR